MIDGPIIEGVTKAAEELQLQLGAGSNVTGVEHRLFDVNEERKIQEFCSRGCGCRLFNNGPCSSHFSRDHYTTMRAQASELSWGELNMTIMGQLMALTCYGPHPLNSTRWRHSLKEREKSTTLYHHQGLRICRQTFHFLHGIGVFRVKAIKALLESQGLVPRVHGHTGRIPPNALILEDMQNIVKFVMQYAEANAILLPGRVPGYKRDGKSRYLSILY